MAMLLSATGDRLKAAEKKKGLSLGWELHLKEQKGEDCHATSVALC